LTASVLLIPPVSRAATLSTAEMYTVQRHARTIQARLQGKDLPIRQGRKMCAASL